MKKIVGAVVLTFTLPIVAFVIFIYYVTGSSKEVKSSDTSLYLHYYIDNGGKAEESLAYYKTREPSKAVVVLTIHEVDPIGFLKFEFSGYDGWSRYGPIKVNYE